MYCNREGWHAIFQDPNLSIESIRHRGVVGTVCQSGLRSICWKVYLGYFPTLELSTWAAVQAEHRQHYTKLKQKYIEEPAEMIQQSNNNQDLTDNNPLALNDNNPWQQYFEDSEIRKTIRQDVDRTFPDVEFFRNLKIQEKMTDILFIYCKLNQDVSYRQGMHELLAPLYWVLEHEAWPTNSNPDPSEPVDRLISQTLDSTFIEHDAYILFEKIMKHAKPWYEFNERIVTKGNRNSTRLNPVVLSCQRIHHQYLRNTDPVLYEHLERYNIEPQLYGMRWLRLLFGREFEFHDLLKLWDAILAYDPSLQIAEYVCLAILLRIHDNLLASDYAQCLTLLMRAPQVGNPATLVEQAKYLQQDLSEASGLHILQQNDLRQGKPPRHTLWEGISKPEQQTIISNRLAHRRSHGANMDGFASITRGVMKSPQVRDLNRAIAGVMGTVQKNVNIIGDNVRSSLDATPTSRRRLTVSSEFPSDIDRHFNNGSNINNNTNSVNANRPSVIRSQPSPQMTAPASTVQRTTTKISSQQQRQDNKVDSKMATMNREMASVLTNSIDQLEKELFMEKKDNEEEGRENGADKEQVLDQVLLINALTGIKHIRDVLAGKQLFDPAALASAIAATTVTTVPAVEESVKSSKNTTTGPLLDDTITVESKEDKDWEIVTDDSDKHTITSSTASEHLETKPLPPLQQSNDNNGSVEHHNTAATPTSKTTTATSTFTTTSSSLVPPTVINNKQNNVVYRIEDLISDPMLQHKESDSKKNSKFKWILQDDANDDNENDSSTKNKNKYYNSFKSSTDTPHSSIPPLRINKRTGLSATDTNSPTAHHMVSSSPSTIDPLGAEGQD
ncbi:rab-GTPase-TBC domain-containing protein [Circinella umbellata]|nr:rab-GTPase-TBC domain-containing protein [Circinella umbellata]